MSVHAIWLGVHIVGVVIAILLIARITEKEAENKTLLLLASVCCLFALVSRCMYIMADTEPALLMAGKLEYFGKCYANYFALLFLIRYRKIKISNWLLGGFYVYHTIMFAIIATNEHHEWYYKSISSKQTPYGLQASFTATPLYQSYMVVNLLQLVLFCVICIVHLLNGKAKAEGRTQLYVSLLLAGMAPFMLLLPRVLGIVNWVDTTPLGILLACLFIVIATQKYGLFNIVSDAKDNVIENLDECIIITDEKMNIMYANPAAKDLFADMLESSTDIYRIFRKAGDIMELGDRSVEIRVSRLNTDGRASGYLFTAVDVTGIMAQANEMRELKDKAEEASRAKSEFVSNMSHEIRTPMNAIIGMTDILLREDLTTKAREYLMNIKHSGNTLVAIINDILDFSKMESGNLEIVEENYSPADILSDFSIMCLNRIGKKPIELLYEIDPDMPEMLCGDAIRIRQIILNLMTNAIKYTEEGFVKLTINVDDIDADTAELTVIVKDSGQGIREDDLEKLFEAFKQVDSKRNHNKEGTGLGLAICKNLVERMGGHIGVRSEYDHGSEFYFTIPQKKVADHKEPVAKWLLDSKPSVSVFVKDAYQEDVVLRLAKNYGLRFVDFEDVCESGIEVDYLFIDSAAYYEDTDTILENKSANTELIFLSNPMQDTIDDDSVISVRKPLYSVNFCRLFVAGTTEAEEETSSILDFKAPDAYALVVDDNEINLAVASVVLEPLRMHVDTVDSGQKAIELIMRKKYDIVFMDHMMPVMDGVETTMRIRAMDEEYYKTVPIIAFTANVVSGVKETLLTAGMNDFLAKPIELDDISAMVKKWLPPEKVVELTQEEIEDATTPQIGEEPEMEIEGIDIPTGIQFCGGQESHLKMMADYYKLIDVKSNKVEKSLADNLIRDYTIEVHALKSSSRVIGALTLSDEFKELEELGNAEEIDLLIAKTPGVLAHYRDYKRILEPFYKAGEKDKAEVEIEDIIEVLTIVADAMDEFDIDRSDEAMNQLEGYQLPDEVSGHMERLRAAMADVAMEDVITISREMADILKGQL